MSQLPTPGGSRLPKVSGLPTPGRSGIPAPGRARSTTNGTSTPHTTAPDSAALSQAFDEVIQANDPRRKGRISNVSGLSLSPPNMTRASPSEGGRKSLGGSVAGSSRAPSARSPSVASAVSTTSSTGYTPRTPISISFQTKTLSTAPPPPPPFSPPYNARPSSARPESRTSNGGARSSSSTKVRTLEIGDVVRIESLAAEGVLRYLGVIEGKPGTYAGVELGGAFADRGKNDGSVAG
jgi:CAP-Gly domain-containing linker protein 1